MALYLLYSEVKLMGRNNTPMMVLAMMIVAVLLALATGALDLEMLNIQPVDRKDTTSQEIEEQVSPMDSLTDRINKINQESSNIISIFILVVIVMLVIIVGIIVLIMINPSKIKEEIKKLDDIEESLRGMEIHGRSRPPEKRSREIYGLGNDNLHVKFVKELGISGKFRPSNFQRKKINDKSQDEVQSVLCPKCKKVHIKTDEEGCWFCNYKWGDIIERKEY